MIVKANENPVLIKNSFSSWKKEKAKEDSGNLKMDGWRLRIQWTAEIEDLSFAAFALIGRFKVKMRASESKRCYRVEYSKLPSRYRKGPKLSWSG